MLDGVHPKSHDKMVKIYGPKKHMLVLYSMKHPSFSFIIQKLIKRMSTCFYIILYHMSRFPTFLSSSQGIWVGSHKDFSPDSHLYKSPENDLYIIIYIFIYTHCLGPWYYIHYIYMIHLAILPRFGMAVTHCHSAWGCEFGLGAVCLGQVRAQAAGTKDQRNICVFTRKRWQAVEKQQWTVVYIICWYVYIYIYYSFILYSL